jgi:hypothetical protein
MSGQHQVWAIWYQTRRFFNWRTKSPLDMLCSWLASVFAVSDIQATKNNRWVLQMLLTTNIQRSAPCYLHSSYLCALWSISLFLVQQEKSCCSFFAPSEKFLLLLSTPSAADGITDLIADTTKYKGWEASVISRKAWCQQASTSTY